MVDFLIELFWETWRVLQEASAFLLFGFAIAGAVAVLVPKELLLRLFARGKVRSVLWASAIGAPLPLCSCGVLPAALGLRREGASKGATVSFLIATPETGVDSISVTYALMDPLMTVFRPVTAVTTAVTAGLVTNFLDRREEEPSATRDPRSAAGTTICLAPGCQLHDPRPGGRFVCEPVPAADADGLGLVAPTGSVWQRIYAYAFRDLLDETSYWIVLAIALSGLIAAALPPDLFEQYLNNTFASMLLMLVVGIPMYTCASASTPLAAALVMKGLNPGAALVFLLAGPATSIGSIVVLLKFLGGRTLAIYLTSIAIVALLAGTLLNWVYASWGLDPRATFGAAASLVPQPLKVVCASVLLALLLRSLWRTPAPSEWRWLGDRLVDLIGFQPSRSALASAALALGVGLWLSNGLFTVGPGEVGLRLHFGQIAAADLAPGLHWRLPWPLGRHETVALDRVRRLEFGTDPLSRENLIERSFAGGRLTVGGPGNPVPEAMRAPGFWYQQRVAPREPFVLTGDSNLIDIRFSLQYRARDPVAFLYAVADPDALVASSAQAALRAVVATNGIDAIYTVARGSIEAEIRRAVQGTLDQHRTGIELVGVHLLYVHPPEEVHDAFRDVASAQEDKLRTINRANAFAVETVNKAKAETAAQIQAGMAFETERKVRAGGQAAAFLLQAQSYRDAPELTLFRLQIEALESALAGVRKIVRPQAAELQELDVWLLRPLPTQGGRN